MLHAHVVNSADVRRSYGLNLALSCVAAGAGVIAWNVAGGPDTAYPNLWELASLAGQCAALIFTREATNHWRVLRAVDEGAPAAQAAPRALPSLAPFVAGLREAGSAAVTLFQAVFAPFAYVRERIDRLGGWAIFVYFGGGWWLVSEGIDLSEGDSTGLLRAPTLVMIGYGLLFLREGFARLHAVFFGPSPASVLHGSARTASPDEAHHAARGNNGGSPFHDQQFRD